MCKMNVGQVLVCVFTQETHIILWHSWPVISKLKMDVAEHKYGTDWNQV